VRSLRLINHWKGLEKDAHSRMVRRVGKGASPVISCNSFISLIFLTFSVDGG
jgi:hypothetical protein